MKNLLLLYLILSFFISNSQCEDPIQISEQFNTIIDSNYFCYKLETGDTTYLAYHEDFDEGLGFYSRSPRQICANGCCHAIEGDLSYMKALDLNNDGYVDCDDAYYISQDTLLNSVIPFQEQLQSLEVLQVYSNHIELIVPYAYTGYIRCHYCDETVDQSPAQKRCLRTYNVDITYWDPETFTETVWTYYFVRKNL